MPPPYGGRGDIINRRLLGLAVTYSIASGSAECRLVYKSLAYVCV